MFKILSFIFLGYSLAFAGTRDEAVKILEKLAPESDETIRMDLASKSFIGLPYGHSGPLGEGPTGRYDQDPLYRFDTFDCTTFVETVVSLSLSANITEFEDQMNEIRYEHAQIDFLKRNHFPSLQWIPNNISNGLLKEINDHIIPKSELKLAEAEINLPGWLKMIGPNEIQVPLATLEEKQSLAQELHQLASSYSPVMARLEYIAISTLLAHPQLLKKIPHGTLVNFVRPNWDLTQTIGTHQNISHQGFLFWKGKTLNLRHASTGGESVVTEQSFFNYIKKYENHPTLKGVHLMQLN
jgi:hypothetical protein